MNYFYVKIVYHQSKLLFKRVTETAKLMVGIPDYQQYLDHMKISHPKSIPLTYEEFFKNRQEIRYNGKSSSRCC